MIKFEVGKTYTMFSPCDQNCTWTYTVVKRTACFVTLRDDHGQETRHRISKAYSEANGHEVVLPLGSYSMNPELHADCAVEPEQAQEEAASVEEGAPVQEQTKEGSAATTRYYPINERTARRAHEMRSMRDYEEGETTWYYRKAVDTVADVAEEQKRKVSKFYHARIDGLRDAYARKLADYYNRESEIGTRCPSLMIAGGSGLDARKKEKQLAAWEANRVKYEECQAILDKIKSVGTGAIDFADPEAREMLQARVNELQAQLDTKKAMNAHYRKHGTMQGFPGMRNARAESLNQTIEADWCKKPAPDYDLASTRNRLKAAQKRLAEFDELRSEGPMKTQFEGGEIVKNVEADRLQIIFDEKPCAEQRERLKANGFRWSPKNGAWQRKINAEAERAVKKALGL